MAWNRGRGGLFVAQIAFFISAGLCGISLFVKLAGGLTIFQLFWVLENDIVKWIYAIPWVYVVILAGISIFLQFLYSKMRFFVYIALIILINLQIVLVTEIFQQTGEFVWGYGGIYFIIGGIMFLLLGFFQLLAFKSEEGAPPPGLVGQGAQNDS